MIEMQLI